MNEKTNTSDYTTNSNDDLFSGLPGLGPSISPRLIDHKISNPRKSSSHTESRNLAASGRYPSNLSSLGESGSVNLSVNDEYD